MRDLHAFMTRERETITQELNKELDRDRVAMERELQPPAHKRLGVFSV